MRVSCVIPAYNEAATVGAVVRAARACPEIHEIIVVSDGSTDDTPQRAIEAGAHVVLVLPRNGGKGGAVMAAVRRAQGEIILLLDADLDGLRPIHISQLLRPIANGRVGMAVALFADDRLHSLLRGLSGQRAVRRILLERAAGRLERAGFGLEVALDRLARRLGEGVAAVRWHGVSHRSKYQKYGRLNALRLQVRASSDLFRQAGTRRSPMAVALALLMVILTLMIPVFLVHPSHASAWKLRSLSPPSAWARVMVVVAHPDDEVIGAGGYIAEARRRGVAVSVVVVTNGDSNRLSAAVITRHVRPKAAQLVAEGRVRQHEAMDALTGLGVAPARVFFLGFPDRALDRVMGNNGVITSPYTGLRGAVYPGVAAAGAPYTLETLVTVMAAIVAKQQPTLIITHAPFDRHADHRAVAELVDTVRGEVPVYAFLVHASRFPRPLRHAPGDPLTPPAGLAVGSLWEWTRFDLSPETEQAKQRAINAYHSQLVTPYLRLLLASFVRTNELFVLRRP